MSRENWPKQWHRRFGWEVNWRRLGLSLEVSWGYWWPQEWTAHVILGPVMVWGGIESCDDFCRDHGHFREDKL